MRSQRSDSSHFSDERWIDFARGLCPESDRAAMERHLETGCTDCRTALARFAGLASVARLDREVPVPEAAVAAARALFQPAHDTGWMAQLKQLTAEWMAGMDTGLRLEGVRSGVSPEQVAGTERLLYRAGNYLVDLKIDHPSVDETGTIVGQITSSDRPGDQLSGVLVQLLTVGNILGETETNQFGEFLLDLSPGKSTTLRFLLRQQGERIDLRLKKRD